MVQSHDDTISSSKMEITYKKEIKMMLNDY